LLLAGCLGVAFVGPTTAAPRGALVAPDGVNAGQLLAEGKIPPSGNRVEAAEQKAQNLPSATVAPAAAPPAVVAGPPLAAREDFAFAPYWTLPQSGSFDLSGLTTLAYFSISVNPDGSLEESGPGWNGYESQALADLITRAHAGDERVVLTVNDFDQGSLNALTSSSTAPATLAAALIPLLQAKNLDGVNFDFEGQGNQDQGGLTNLIAVVSTALRRADPHWQVTMDTYASSAGDPGGFYDIPALAPFVDAFFVMAYDLNLSATPTPASPLTSSMFSDLTTLEQYSAVVPATKVILGAPFFGIDWPTNDGTLGAQATGAAADIADSLVQSSADPQYWDPLTDTGWTSYQVGDQWYETYYEDPLGLFDLAQLAARFDVRGVGIWALGMEGDDAQMIAALDGVAPVAGADSTGPVSTSSSPTSAPPGIVSANPSGVGTPGSDYEAAPAGPSAPLPSTSPSATAPTSPSVSATPSTASPTATSTTTTTTTSAPPAVAPRSITGVFDGGTRTLTPVSAGAVATLVPLGNLTGFATTDPAYACLAQSPSLTVYAYGLLSGYDVAVATTPTDCVNEDFTFPT
jgi:spore germination protein